MEAGGASEIVSLLDAGVPLVETQADLTPFQRQVIVKELERREEAKQEQMPDTGVSPGAKNPHASGGGMQGETVTYTNDGGD